MPPPVVFQKQKKKFCAVHAYNNAMQSRVLKYDLTKFIPKSKKTGKTIKGLGSKKCGNYSPSVVARAFNSLYDDIKSRKLSRFTQKKNLSFKMLEKKIANGKNKKQKITKLIVILTKPYRHNVAFVYGGKRWYYVDSELDKSYKINRELYDYLTKVRGLERSAKSIYAIVPSHYKMYRFKKKVISLV